MKLVFVNVCVYENDELEQQTAKTNTCQSRLRAQQLNSS